MCITLPPHSSSLTGNTEMLGSPSANHPLPSKIQCIPGNPGTPSSLTTPQSISTLLSSGYGVSFTYNTHIGFWSYSVHGTLHRVRKVPTLLLYVQ